MAKPPNTTEYLVDRYGPHIHRGPPAGQAERIPDRAVNTHCCFCGQQCGITLLVSKNEVVGFEPWEEFPFNKGKLCPKGVKRYLQNGHPDRLLYPLEQGAGDFERRTWDHAYGRVAGAIQSIQTRYGRDSFAVLSGVSMTNEKGYLMGKFARAALETREIDYNGRLCMTSAGAGNRKAFGIDRAANPWSDIPLAQVLILAGTNVSECSPITTDYVWRARDNGARVIVIDPRETPIARTADLHLAVRPGRDDALMNAILHVVIERGHLDEAFIREHTVGFDEVRAMVRQYTPERAAEISGVPAADIITAAEWWGAAKTGMLLHARGIEHHSKGVNNVLSCINLVLATGKIGKPGSGYGTITGQGNGQGGREHGQRCDQLPGYRSIENPEHRQYIADVWGIPEPEMPQKGHSAVEIMELIHEGKIKGLLSICFNPLVSMPDAHYVAEALEKLEFFVAIDFFLSETARYADVVLPGSLHEEDEGTVTTVEGRVVRIRQAVEPPGEAKKDWRIICDLAARLGKEKLFPYQSAEDIFHELRVASRGGIADYYGITYDRIEKEMGVFWPCPALDHPGTPRLFEGGRFSHPDGKARFHAIEHQPPKEVPDDEYPLHLTTGRTVLHFLSGTQTRRIGFLADECPEPWIEMHVDTAAAYGIRSDDLVRVSSRRGAIELKALVTKSIRPDTVFVPYHWADDKSVNRLTIRALDPTSKIPEYKVCACRIEKVAARPRTERVRLQMARA
jgi:assimilatory nitrate reductase catalytic subunit